LNARSSGKFLDHFYPSGDGGRWTEERSGIWLPGLGGGNLSWRGGLTLSGPRFDRFATQPHVVVRANAATVAEFDARHEEDHEFEMRPWQLGLNGNLLLEIESTTFKPDADESGLGVRVSRVWVTRANGVALPSVRAFVLSLALIGSVVALMRMAANAGLMSIQRMPMSAFCDPFRNRWAWALVVLWLLIAIARVWNPLEMLWWLQIITCALLFALALSWMISRIISGPLQREQSVALLILFLLAAAIQIAFDFGRGYEGNIASYGKQGDIAIYVALAWKTVGHGIQSAYQQIADSPPSDNPPLLLYPFWFFGWLYEKLNSPSFSRTPLGDPQMLRFMLRLPALSADLLTGAVIFRFLRQRSTISFNAAFYVAVVYVLNPVLIFDSAYWGQTAVVHSLFMLLAIIATDRRNYSWAGVALAAAILTKPQAIAIAPLVLLLAAKERGAWRFIAGGIVATLIITLPFILVGNIGTVIQQYKQTTQFHPFVAPNAHNFWWCVTGGAGWQPDTNFFGRVTFRTAGFLLFSASTLLSLAIIWAIANCFF
jgi:hypothetical protein